MAPPPAAIDVEAVPERGDPLLYRAAFETAALGIRVTDLEGRIIETNRAFRDLVGYEADELRRMTFADLTHPDDRPGDLALFRDLAAGRRDQYRIEKRFIHRDGRELWVRVSVALARGLGGEPRYAVGIVEDVTDRRRTEEKLRQNVSILHAIAEGTTDAIFVKDLRGRYLMINSAGARFLGKTVEEVIGRDDTELFTTDSALEIMLHDRQVLDSGEAQTLEDVGTAAGVTRTYLSTKGPYRDENGRVIGIVGISRDITARKEAEDALRNSEALYHSLVEGLPVAVFRKDLDGRFTFGNRRFWEGLAKRPEDILGKTDFDFFPPEQAEKYRKDDRRVVKTGKVFEDVEEHAGPDGVKRHVHVLKTPVYDYQGRVVGTQGIFWDVTSRRQTEETLKQTAAELARSYQRLQQLAADLEKSAASERRANETLKKAQSQLVQSEKLAALGQTVAGVAHEINNPLSYVINNTAVLQRDVGLLRELLGLYQEAAGADPGRCGELRDRIKQFAELIDLPYTLSNLDGLLPRTRDGLKRIQQIVRDLRDFARLDEGDLQEADINAGVRSTMNIVRGRALKHNVRLEVDLEPLPPIVCFPAKINQVVLNLVANAIDACPEAGQVTVRTAAETDGVSIHVIDNGHGIDPAVRDRIFDPFFTTKPPGQGTGLGLSISYGIVADHGGRIDIQSAPGQGAHFTVQLPLRPPASMSRLHPPARPAR